MPYKNIHKLFKYGNYILKYGEDDIKNELKKNIKKDIFSKLSDLLFEYLEEIDSKIKSIKQVPSIKDFIWLVDYYYNSDNDDKLISNYYDLLKQLKIIINKIEQYDVSDIDEYFKNKIEIFINISKKFKIELTFLLEKINNIEDEVDKKIKELTDLDWRPTETVPEDYYAL